MATVLTSGRQPENETFGDPRFIPAGRFGEDSEMGGAMLYLASRAGSYCNGFILVNDGGRMGVMQSAY